jgi:serine/threonine protein kinase
MVFRRMSNTGNTEQSASPADDRTIIQPPDHLRSTDAGNVPTLNQPFVDDTKSQLHPRRTTGEANTPQTSTVLELPPEVSNPFGRYQLQRLLGKGGMGAVYLALDTQLDRQVALKIPFFGKDDGPDLIDRFRREARSMATQHHPNLCQVYDVGEIGGVQFLTMEFVDGRSLSELLRQGFHPGDVPLAALMEKLALALESAHRVGIIHRDLKPANIIIRPDGEPVIMDFGLARRHKEGEAELTHSGMLLGTPAYMAPEQVEARHDVVCPATDVYALGVILYVLLTGRAPFEGSVGSVLAGIIHQAPPPPHTFQPQINPQLESICMRAMAKSIEQRYASARDMAGDLRRFQEVIASGSTTIAMPVNGNTPAKAATAAAESPVLVASQRRAGSTWRWLWIAATGTAVLAAVTALLSSRQEHPAGAARRTMDGGTQTSSDQRTASSQSANKNEEDLFAPRPDAPDQSWRLPPEPRRYPSLHDTISHPPSWLIADQQAPFDLAKYFEVPVWEDNAAPAYLKAMFEYAPEVEYCFPEATREKQRSTADNRARQCFNLHNQWQQDRNSVNDDEVEALLTEVEAGYDLLRMAQRKRECVFEIGAGLDSSLPHIQTARCITRVEAQRARLALGKGQIERAIETAGVLLRLSRDINNRGVSITHLTACANDTIVFDDVIRPILLHPNVTQKQCDRLLELLTEHDRRKDDILRQVMRGEYVFLRVMLHDFQYRTGGFSKQVLTDFGITPEAGSDFRTPGEAIAKVLLLWRQLQPLNQMQTFDQARLAQRINVMSDLDYEKEVALCDSGFHDLLAVCDRPVWQRMRLCSRIQDQFARNQTSRIVRNLDLPNQTVHADRQNRTQLAGLICLTCLRKYQFDHAVSPASLESLLNSCGIEELIADPYGSGEPFRYRQLDGQPVVYSLAANEVDEEGLHEWDLNPEGAGDLTFRMEAFETLARRRKRE